MQLLGVKYGDGFERVRTEEKRELDSATEGSEEKNRGDIKGMWYPNIIK